MSVRLLRHWLGVIKGPGPAAGSDPYSLRTWFVGFIGWLVLLTAIGVWAFHRVEQGHGNDLGVWLTAIALFYLSLCCLFFPLPTAWIVLLLASNDVALIASVPLRVVVVATLCAAATAIANLNEYHILTFLLRYRKIGRVRDTRVYDRAERWFRVAPFWTITAFSFLPIPVDVIRMLAITARYPRFPFAGAYFLGRFVRYGLFAISSAWLSLGVVHIALVQGLFVVLAASKIAHASFRRRKAAAKDRATDSAPVPQQLVTANKTP